MAVNVGPGLMFATEVKLAGEVERVAGAVAGDLPRDCWAFETLQRLNRSKSRAEIATSWSKAHKAAALPWPVIKRKQAMRYSGHPYDEYLVPRSVLDKASVFPDSSLAGVQQVLADYRSDIRSKPTPRWKII